VSYNDKHNEANGEDGRDGESHNRSWNCGAEGPTDDPEVIALRLRQQRNFLATLLLSQGVPMIAHGDEIGRTQQGNNNVYCQDNELAWVDWDLDDDQKRLYAFTAAVSTLRRDHAVFRRRRFFAGSADHGGQSELGDIAWFQPSGQPMAEHDWSDGEARTVMVFFNGQAIPSPDNRGRRVLDDDFLVIFNADHEEDTFVLPGKEWGEHWMAEINTGVDLVDTESHPAGSELKVQPRSLIVLRSPRETPPQPSGAATTIRT
jgi:isoamylase